MPFSHDELDALRAESLAHHTNTHTENEVVRKRQALRRKLLLAAMLLVTAFAMFVATSKHWQAIISTAKG